MSKQKAAKKLSVPRSMQEIQTAYQQLCANLGQLEYQIAIQKEEAIKLKENLKAVNNEAAARQQLDKQSAEAPKVEEQPQQAAGV